MTYNNDSIRSLGILGGVREKPASVGIESNNHTFLEILANSIDEARSGFGDEIIVTKHKNGEVSIRDFGRGVPMGKNKDGEYAYKKVFDELWSGGKYDNNDDNVTSGYKYSLGTNGVGATATNYVSDRFFAMSYNGTHVQYIEYKKGIEQHELKKESSNGARGTLIGWIPSQECFRGKGEIEDEFIETTLQDQSVVNNGLKFIFINEKNNEEKIYYYENGIIDFIKEISPTETTLINPVGFTTEQIGRDNNFDKDYKIKAEIYFSFSRDFGYSRFYHSTSWLENGGTPEDFVKNSFTFAIDKYIKDNNLYSKSEKKISFEDISDSLIVVTSTYSTISLFTDQTKKKIGSDFMKTYITKWLREQLEVYFVENPKEAKLIATQVLVNKRSREKAEKTRLDVKKKLSGTVNNITAKVEGFVNCKSKDRTKTELFIVEGKSALGSTVQGRDSETQAIYAIRGKILNCLKADYDRIFKNDIIVDLIKILGCGIEAKNKHTKDLNTFNMINLKWSKIIITTDADVDGYHIRCLVLAVIHRLMPSLIKEGKVFIVESPLFEIIDKDDVSHFAFTDAEKDKIVKKLGKKVALIQRSKGLGENTAEMMWETTMNPENRKLIQVVEDDNLERMIKNFEMFLGDDLEGRKEYIENNLNEYIDEVLV